MILFPRCYENEQLSNRDEWELKMTKIMSERLVLAAEWKGNVFVFFPHISNFMYKRTEES